MHLLHLTGPDNGEWLSNGMRERLNPTSPGKRAKWSRVALDRPETPPTDSLETWTDKEAQLCVVTRELSICQQDSRQKGRIERNYFASKVQG